MKEEEISHEESLKIISDMIGLAKTNIARGGSFYFLMWGFVVAIANLSFYYLEVIASYDKPYLVWLIIIPAVIVTSIYSYRQEKNAKSYGHLDKVYGQLWIAIFVCIMITLVFATKIGMFQNAVILLMSGLGTYVTGQMLKFMPLILGGVALWVGAVVAFTVSPADQSLVAGIALIIGYIVPGFLLKKEELKQ